MCFLSLFLQPCFLCGCFLCACRSINCLKSSSLCSWLLNVWFYYHKPPTSENLYHYIQKFVLFYISGFKHLWGITPYSCYHFKTFMISFCLFRYKIKDQDISRIYHTSFQQLTSMNSLENMALLFCTTLAAVYFLYH